MVASLPDSRVRRALVCTRAFAILDLVAGLFLLFLAAGRIVELATQHAPAMPDVWQLYYLPNIAFVLFVTLSAGGLAAGGYLLSSGSRGRYGRLRLGAILAPACALPSVGLLLLAAALAALEGQPLRMRDVSFVAVLGIIPCALAAAPWLLFGRTYRALAAGGPPGPS